MDNYHLAKPINFGLLYFKWGSANPIYSLIGRQRRLDPESSSLFKSFYNAYPKIQNFHDIFKSSTTPPVHAPTDLDFSAIERRIAESLNILTRQPDFDDLYVLEAKAQLDAQAQEDKLTLCNCSTQILMRSGCNCGGL